MSSVIITQNDDIERAIAEALEHIDLEPLVRGKIVAVKPNDTWASREDCTAVTQPDTLRGALRSIKGFGPRALVVTGGAGAGETDEIFRIAGLMDVVESEGAEFFDHNRPPFTEVKLEYAPEKDVAGPQASVMVNPRVFEYETLITLNKVHETATVTLSLKNIAMSYPAADYYGHPRGDMKQGHAFFQDMHSFIAAMARRFPAQLAITAGHPAMIGIGPIGGHTFETGLVIASTDPLAADAVGAQLLGFTARGVHHLWEAARLGLGECDTDRMKFPAMSLEEAFAAFTRAAYGKSLSRGG
ncbi:MAG: DUF362 domain-containing protein [Verrucomicrobiota bacterium]|nr:DUF362 domain-containing protein [Verrucomicrobiota bacterium]